MFNKMSDEKGTKHFIHQRKTAFVLIPLVIWMCFSLAFLPDAQYHHIIDWIKFPINTALLVIVMVAAFYHAQLGLQVIIEDYISTISLRKKILGLMNLACIILCLIGLFSIFKIVS